MSNEIKSFEDIVREIDPINTEYIMQDSLILQQYDSYRQWKSKEKFCRSLVVDCVGKNGRVDEDCDRVAASVLECLKEEIGKKPRSPVRKRKRRQISPSPLLRILRYSRITPLPNLPVNPI